MWSAGMALLNHKRRRMTMFGKAKTGIALAMLVALTGFGYASAQEKTEAVEAGTFHGKVHKTSGRATIYKEANGQLVLRLTNFKTSNGPDVHVVLIAAKDADDDANFLKSSTERLELGALKGNEGDQNYTIPAGTDLDKFQTVSIYCVRFNANFGAAPLKRL
jgi:Electron transfer DM13